MKENIWGQKQTETFIKDQVANNQWGGEQWASKEVPEELRQPLRQQLDLWGIILEWSAKTFHLGG